ncbi:MAG: DegT/DnrJ/EryC1/StrS aminotransferase family protein [Betaproteobacteria bacterium]|nr:DegT/DnrJ/EryC1/StrS aminotransferase family protein [Betaproteobacteria bacterium]
MSGATLKHIPFARPTLTPAMADAVSETLLSHWIASGPQVQAFEKALSAYHGGRPARVFTSATAAMEVAFQICGIGATNGGNENDEVITSAMTFFSVGNMIEKSRAKTVFVDCDLLTRNMDLDQVERAITPRTKAIVPTHFGGLPCDMDRLYDIARRHKIRVIEDAALAIGSSWRRQKIGAFGDIATFSFHPNKNMTTIEGGAAVFANEADAKRAEVLRFHGIERMADGTRDVKVAGGKFNMSDVSARLGVEQLKLLDGWCAQRRGRITDYFELLSPHADAMELVLPAPAHAGEPDGHSWNMFCILLPLSRLAISRKQLMDAMAARQIGTGISYEAMHLTSLFRNKGHKDGEFPNAERIARETLTLPLFPTMTRDDVERVVATLLDILRSNRKA